MDWVWLAAKEAWEDAKSTQKRVSNLVTAISWELRIRLAARRRSEMGFQRLRLNMVILGPGCITLTSCRRKNTAPGDGESQLYFSDSVALGYVVRALSCSGKLVYYPLVVGRSHLPDVFGR